LIESTSGSIFVGQSIFRDDPVDLRGSNVGTQRDKSLRDLDSRQSPGQHAVSTTIDRVKAALHVLEGNPQLLVMLSSVLHGGVENMDRIHRRRAFENREVRASQNSMS